MIKRGFLGVFALVMAGIIISILLISGAYAQNENATTSSDNVGKAFECVEDLINDKTTISFYEAAFSALAGANPEKNLGDIIESYKRGNLSCWPKDGCRIKDTAIAALAYNALGRNTENIKNWLMAKNSTASNLKWALQIDIQSNEEAECTIKEGPTTGKITILNDMSITGDPGRCFSIDAGGYWLNVNSNCIDRIFQISCNKDFSTSVVYSKSSGETTFILPETHSAASSGTTEEKISGKCFRAGVSCDYEATMWAALALSKMGEDVSSVIPYLTASAEDNARFFPSAFLYMLVSGEEYYDEIIKEQKQSKFWEISPGNKFYDSAVALLALSGTSAQEAENTKDYLFEIQTKNGCWNNDNLRDSAFLLYAGWAKISAGGGAGGTTIEECEPLYYCENRFECTEAGGDVLYDFNCAGTKLCCSINVQEQTCSALNGIICPDDKECSGETRASADGTCCLDSCVLKPTVTDECTPAGGACRTLCEENEEEYSASCEDEAEICCVETIAPAEPTEGFGFWWIILILLIIIIVLGIIYRDKLRIWMLQMKEKFAKKEQRPGMAGRGISPGAPMRPPMMAQRPVMPSPSRGGMPQRMPARAPAKNREMDETLRKLKEMAEKK